MVSEAMAYLVKFYGLSDIGHVRENNEDVWKALPERRFFVLADGMGGHRAGEVAAETAVNAICSEVDSMLQESSGVGFDEAQGMIQLAIEKTNYAVFDKSFTSASLAGMGTTLCCMYFHDQGLVYAHVGDSRIYRFHEGKLELLTRDHSLVREMIDKGHLTKKESQECGFKNVITRAIGTEASIEPSVHMSDVSENDQFLMCTDGLTDLLSLKEMEAILLEQSSLEAATRTLIERAKDKGGHDNITVVIVQTK